MSARPKKQQAYRASLFSDSGDQTKKLSLFNAVFYDRTSEAQEIIKAAPDQINLQESFAALTSLHLAIFRQNVHIVRDICQHPVTQINLEDRFGRRAIDMCVYTINAEIFTLVSNRSFQKAIMMLEEGDDGGVVPFR